MRSSDKEERQAFVSLLIGLRHDGTGRCHSGWQMTVANAIEYQFGWRMSETVLITGGTGSFGKTMLHRILDTDIGEIRIFSRDEEKQDAMRHGIQDSRVRYHIGDVRDRESVLHATKGVDRIFHAAALKQVPSCEFFPMEAIRTNVIGSENVVRAAIANGVKSLVCLSTDKAVMPVNAMGMSKALMEKVARAAARELGPEAGTMISCVRYGNVMYSRGSVIPLFIRQIRDNQPITLTEPSMTRFLMPLRDSISLVLFAFEHANQGDIFIRKAASATIADLALAVKNVMGVPDHPVEVIGWRHGEKLYESLASGREMVEAKDMGDYFRLPLDARQLNYAKYLSQGVSSAVQEPEYSSHDVEQLAMADLEALLLSLDEVQEQRRIAGVAS